jgi:hypothetical protein
VVIGLRVFPSRPAGAGRGRLDGEHLTGAGGEHRIHVVDATPLFGQDEQRAPALLRCRIA